MIRSPNVHNSLILKLFLISHRYSRVCVGWLYRETRLIFFENFLLERTLFIFPARYCSLELQFSNCYRWWFMACIMNFRTDTSRLRTLFHTYLFSLNRIAGINFSQKENDIHSGGGCSWFSNPLPGRPQAVLFVRSPFVDSCVRKTKQHHY